MKEISTIEHIYTDFDGTVTKADAVNTFLAQYASEKWIYFEDLWKAGKISSKQNAIEQLNLLSIKNEQVIDDYINNIKIDETFIEFVKFAHSQNIGITILSDGFDLFINKVLERYNLKNIEVFANHVTYKDHKLDIEFPYYNENCKVKAGMCKCDKITHKNYCYIGDGTSDLCVAKKSKILFAKSTLLKYCKENHIPAIEFNSFDDIKNYITKDNQTESSNRCF